jgi:hypothetical protein
MNKTENAQTLGGRAIVESLDREFARLYVNSCGVIENTPTDILYAAPEQGGSNASSAGLHHLPSIGESVLRAAAAMEQTFGGITANLWDDPFEWTLPEYLSTPAKVRRYLTEVEETRNRAFSSFGNDDCLLKRVALPSGETQPLIALVLETLVRATHYQSQAQGLLTFFPRLVQLGLLSRSQLND